MAKNTPITKIKLFGCALKRIETKDGVELEIRPVDMETGRVADMKAIYCHMETDGWGNPSGCHGVGCPKPKRCAGLSDGDDNYYCMCTGQNLPHGVSLVEVWPAAR